MIFLDAIEDWPDLDAWYLPRRRLVLGGLLGANVANWVASVVLVR